MAAARYAYRLLQPLHGVFLPWGYLGSSFVF